MENSQECTKPVETIRIWRWDGKNAARNWTECLVEPLRSLRHFVTMAITFFSCNQDNKNIIHICIINIMDWNIWIISIIKYYYNIKSINWMIKLLNMIQCYGLKSEGKWGGGRKLVWNRLAETTLKRRGRRKDRYVEHVTLLADSDEPVELLRDGSMHRLKEIQTNETKGMSRRFV